MGADASIYSLIKPAVQQQGPLDQYTQGLQLKHLMGQGDLQAMQLQQAQRAAQDDMQLRDLFARNPNATPEQVMPINPQRGMQMRKDAVDIEGKRATIDKDKAAAGKSLYEINKDKLERGAALLANAKDQQSYDMVMTLGAQSGIFAPEFMQNAPRQFDPNWVSSMQNAGITRAQQLEQEHKAKVLAETGRHNLSTEANAAGQLKVAQGQLGVAQGNLGLSRQRLEMEKNAPKGQYDADRAVLVDTRTGVATPVTMGGAPLGPKEKLTDTQKKELASIDSQQSVIRGALAAVEKTPDAFGTVRGLATMAGAIPESMAGKLDSPEQREARSYVFNVASKVINERAGAAQSAQELARLRSFLPAETDNADQVRDKLVAFQSYLDNSRAGYDRAQTGAKPVVNPAPAPKTFNSMPDPKQYDGKSIRSDDGVVYKSNGKSWVRQMGG